MLQLQIANPSFFKQISNFQNRRKSFQKSLQNLIMIEYVHYQSRTLFFKIIQVLVLFSVVIFTCAPNCLTCDNSFCNICQNSFSLTNNCKQCQINCQNCSLSYSYFFTTCVNSICDDNNCIICSSFNTATCYECDSGTSINNGTCTSNSTSSINMTTLVIFIIASIVFTLLALFFFRKIYLCCLQRRLDMERDQALAMRQKNARQSAFMIYDKKNEIWKSLDDQDTFPYRQICSICLERSVDAKTTCNHTFHFHCLVEWAHRNDSCPQCRAGLDKVIVFCIICHKKYIERSVIVKKSIIFGKVCNYCSEQNKGGHK